MSVDSTKPSDHWQDEFFKLLERTSMQIANLTEMGINEANEEINDASFSINFYINTISFSSKLLQTSLESWQKILRENQEAREKESK